MRRGKKKAKQKWRRQTTLNPITRHTHKKCLSFVYNIWWMLASKDVNKKKSVQLWKLISEKWHSFCLANNIYIIQKTWSVCDSSMQTIIWFLGNSYRLHMSYVRAILNVLFYRAFSSFANGTQIGCAFVFFFLLFKVICFSLAKDKTENIKTMYNVTKWKRTRIFMKITFNKIRWQIQAKQSKWT